MSAADASARPVAIVLAAGKGSRMRSRTTKMLHRAAGRPLLSWVLDAARDAGCERIFVIVGHGAEAVREACGGDDVEWILQEEQRGTGHAVAQARAAIASRQGPAFVLSGDAPLVRGETLRLLLRAASEGWGAMAVAEVAEPGSLGRVMRRQDGGLSRIVEVSDASEEELGVRLVNAGHYVLPLPDLFSYLDQLHPTNVKGELYLTDALVAAAAQGCALRCVELDDPSEAWGVNDRHDLARVHGELLRRKALELMTEGVTLLDPSSTVVEPSVTIAPDTVVHPGVTLLGATRIGEACELHRGVWMRDTLLDRGIEVGPYSVLDGAEVAAGCRVGPFARLRPGARLAEDVRIGNFVEVKKSEVGRGAKANHLAYLGDARVGAGANIGAGTVTCNYDGKEKHRTEIGDGAFIGSDTMLVAPVRVGDRAVTGAGSVITKDVPDDALAVGRARQRIRADWSRRREGRKTPPSRS